MHVRSVVGFVLDAAGIVHVEAGVVVGVLLDDAAVWPTLFQPDRDKACCSLLFGSVTRAG